MTRLMCAEPVLKKLHVYISNAEALRTVLNGPPSDRAQQSNDMIRIAIGRMFVNRSVHAADPDMEEIEPVGDWIKFKLEKMDDEIVEKLHQQGIEDVSEAGKFTAAELKAMQSALKTTHTDRLKGGQPPSGPAL